MKRIFMILAAFGIFSTVAVNAQSTEEQTQPAEEQVLPSDDQEQPAQQEETTMQDKKEIQFSELPEAVQTGFGESEFAAWEVTKVYEVSGDEGIHYELTVSDGSTEQTVKLDEAGQIKEE